MQKNLENNICKTFINALGNIFDELYLLKDLHEYYFDKKIDDNYITSNTKIIRNKRKFMTSRNKLVINMSIYYKYKDKKDSIFFRMYDNDAISIYHKSSKNLVEYVFINIIPSISNIGAILAYYQNHVLGHKTNIIIINDKLEMVLLKIKSKYDRHKGNKSTKSKITQNL